MTVSGMRWYKASLLLDCPSLVLRKKNGSKCGQHALNFAVDTVCTISAQFSCCRKTFINNFSSLNPKFFDLRTVVTKWRQKENGEWMGETSLWFYRWMLGGGGTYEILYWVHEQKVRWIVYVMRDKSNCLLELARMATAVFRDASYKVIVGQFCQLLIGTMSSQFKSYHILPFTLLTGTWMNGCWICGYWRHSRHTVIWLHDPFDSWSPQIPGDPEATTPASASSGRRRGKLPLSEPHLDRCSVRWSLGSEPAPTLSPPS